MLSNARISRLSAILHLIQLFESVYQTDISIGVSASLSETYKVIDQSQLYKPPSVETQPRFNAGVK